MNLKAPKTSKAQIHLTVKSSFSNLKRCFANKNSTRRFNQCFDSAELKISKKIYFCSNKAKQLKQNNHNGICDHKRRAAQRNQW